MRLRAGTDLRYPARTSHLPMLQRWGRGPTGSTQPRQLRSVISSPAGSTALSEQVLDPIRRQTSGHAATHALIALPALTSLPAPATPGPGSPPPSVPHSLPFMGVGPELVEVTGPESVGGPCRTTQPSAPDQRWQSLDSPVSLPLLFANFPLSRGGTLPILPKRRLRLSPHRSAYPCLHECPGTRRLRNPYWRT